MRRIPSLDGLRAISILMVVIGHWASLHYQSEVGGSFANLGVRIFFIISGYLITTLLLKEYARTSTIQLREFYVRRAYRILPAAMAFMLPVFVIYWHQLHWYHMAAAALYVTNFDYAHPWFLGHLWSLSVEEQFYFLWPSVVKKWHRHKVAILLGVVALAPVYRVACHFLKLHGKADETFPAVADILAVGCLLAIYAPRLPRIKRRWALLMILPVALVPVYVADVHFRTTPLLLLILWPVLHVSIAGLLLHAVQTPYWILNIRPVAWLGKISYSLYLWQQLFAYGPEHRAWYWLLVPVGLASLSYYLVEQPMLWLREKRSQDRAITKKTYARAA
jgi:peptidoglycan/LPS O-acetylase OafA/YrhL